MGGVAVHIDSAVEHGRGILADARSNHGLATRVVLDEVGNIVDDASDGNQSTTILGLVDIIVPFHDR